MLRSLGEETILPAHCLWTGIATLPWVSSLPAYPTEFGLASGDNRMSHFLKVNTYISLSLSLIIIIDINIEIWCQEIIKSQEIILL